MCPRLCRNKVVEVPYEKIVYQDKVHIYLAIYLIRLSVHLSYISIHLISVCLSI